MEKKPQDEHEPEKRPAGKKNAGPSAGSRGFQGRIESERRILQALIDPLPDFIFQKDLEGRFVLANRSMASFLGLDDPTEFVGKTDAHFLPREIADAMVSEDRTVIETARPLEILEESIPSVSGSRRWFSTTKAPLLDGNGGVIGIVGIGRDVTERKALEMKNEQLASLVESSEEAIVSFDLNRRITTWNRGAERLYGYAAEEMIGNATSVTIPPELEEEARLMRERVLHGAEITRYESTRIRKDGSRLIVSLSLSAIRNPEGGITGIASVGRDITEQRRNQEALRESERRITDIFDFLPDATFAIDGEGRITAWNHAIEQMTGKKKEQMLSRGDYEYAIPFYASRRPMLIDIAFKNREEFISGYDYVEKKGDTVTAEGYVPLLYDGKGAYLWALTSLLRNEKGEVVGAIESIRDITERKRAEEEKVKLEDKLQQIERIESVGRLAGGVAHDFNNMLGVILGHTDMALEQVDRTLPLHEDLLQIRKAAEHSAALTRQLLAFARKQTVVPQVLDLNLTIQGMLVMLERLIGEDIRLDWKPNADLWPVKMDPSQIDQLLTNLCINARDAIADVGNIMIETGNRVTDEAFRARHPDSPSGEYVLISVTDDGCGMDQGVRAHLFEPFFTTKEVGKGTGLGLATVWGIVQQNKGFIDVESEPGRGSTFAIHLPRYTGAVEQAHGVQAEGAIRGGREKILLVEDELLNLRMTKRMLEAEGYCVFAASTPGEAIRLAREHGEEIQLLITDVIMPEMNGRDLARNLLSLYPRLKCLYASGYTADIIVPRGVADEGMHFLQKPFSKKDLALKVREALDGNTAVDGISG